MSLKDFFIDYLKSYFKTVKFGLMTFLIFSISFFLALLQTNDIDVSAVIATLITVVMSIILQFFVFKIRKIPAWFGIMEPFYKKYYGEKTTNRMYKLFIIFIILMVLFFLVMTLILDYNIFKI